MSELDTPLETWLEDILEKDYNPRELVRCRVCDAALTHQRERASIAGSHHHRFINPANIEFELGCFRSAPGCSITGMPSPAHTWFPGYDWQYALCAECLEHVGWFYLGHDKTTFYGLILARLRFPEP